METQPPFAMFKPLELQVLANRLGFTKGQIFEFGLGSRLVHELGSFAEGSNNPMTQTSTPKSVDKVATEIIQVDKVAELF